MARNSYDFDSASSVEGNVKQAKPIPGENFLISSNFLIWNSATVVRISVIGRRLIIMEPIRANAIDAAIPAKLSRKK